MITYPDREDSPGNPANTGTEDCDPKRPKNGIKINFISVNIILHGIYKFFFRAHLFFDFINKLNKLMAGHPESTGNIAMQEYYFIYGQINSFHIESTSSNTRQL